MNIKHVEFDETKNMQIFWMQSPKNHGILMSFSEIDTTLIIQPSPVKQDQSEKGCQPSDIGQRVVHEYFQTQACDDIMNRSLQP